MTTLRTDILTGRRVIIAADRAARPQQTSATVDHDGQPSPRDQTEADDPFLEGHEHDTPDERLALRRKDSQPNAPGWLLRVVPNRYPAVHQQPDGESCLTGMHEVVVECPDLRSGLIDLSVAEVARMLFAWQTRIRELSQLAGIAEISVFRNEGWAAGASLTHSHSQVLAAGFVSPQNSSRVALAVEHQSSYADSLYQFWLRFELNNETRVVETTDHVAVICPFASRMSWHTRICPINTTPCSFADLSETALGHLAGRLLTTAMRLKQAGITADQNLCLVIPPVEHTDLFPWMLEILPRTSRVAGFELMTDTDIVTVQPESAAERLRSETVTLPDQDSRMVLYPEGFHWVNFSDG